MSWDAMSLNAMASEPAENTVMYSAYAVVGPPRAAPSLCCSPARKLAASTPNEPLGGARKSA
eukprot:5004443-Prymnesium_polylepis.1